MSSGSESRLLTTFRSARAAAVRVGTLEIAIFNIGEGFLAVENRCPHGGGPLADGIVGGQTVTCPLHNWRVCLESGAREAPLSDGATAVTTFPVSVIDGIVMRPSTRPEPPRRASLQARHAGSLAGSIAGRQPAPARSPAWQAKALLHAA